MMPSTPMRGRAGIASALSVDVLVAVVERIDVLSGERDGIAEHPREVHSAGDVLAHHRRLDRVAGPGAEGEHAVAAQQDGRRAVVGERLDHDAPDLLVTDQGEWGDGDLATELVGHRGEHARDRLPAWRPRRRRGS